MKLFPVASAFLVLLLTWPIGTGAASQTASQPASQPASQTLLSQTSLPTLNPPAPESASPTPFPTSFPPETPLPAVNETPLPTLNQTILAPSGPGSLSVDTVRPTGITVLSFQTNDYAVRVTRRAENYFMNVYNRRTSSLELFNVSAVEVETGPHISGLTRQIFIAEQGELTYTAFARTANVGNTNTVTSLLISYSDRDKRLRNIVELNGS